MLIIFLFGFSSGLPLALVGSMLQAWFQTSGLDLVSIGFLSLAGQPYTYKFLWAPLLDKFNSPFASFFDKRRGWILTAQILIILTIIIMASLDPKVNPFFLGFLGLILGFMSATQDIAIDAYRVEVLVLEDERGLGSALAVEGYRVAMIVSGGVGFILADRYGWQATYLIMAGFMLVGVVAAFFAQSLPAKAFNSNHGNIRQLIWEPLRQFLKKEQALWLLALIILYKLGDAFSHALTTPFLIDLGFSLTAIGTINKGVGLSATLVGIMCAGIFMTRVSLFKSMLFFGCLQGVTNLLYMLLASVGKNYFLAVGVFFLENLCAGMGNTALAALIIGLCTNKEHSAAHFALMSSLMAVGRVYVGPVSGVLVKLFGWQVFYCWTAILALPGIFLILFLKPQIMLCDKRDNNPGVSIMAGAKSHT